MKLYRTGEACPLCGQPIRLKRKAELFALSAIAQLSGINGVARTDEAVKAAEDNHARYRKAGWRR